MKLKVYLLFLLTTLINQTPLLSAAIIRRKLSFASSSSSNSSSSTGAQIFCDSTADCPVHSVCYQNTCICDFGYTFQQKVFCIRLPCSTDLDCQGIFLHSKCSALQGAESHHRHCICSDDAYLDPFNQECYQKMNQIVLWFGFLTIVGIIIFLPAGKLVARQREIRRQSRLLEAEQQAAQGPLGTLSFGNAGVVNYDDAYLYYYHTVNNSHSSNVFIVSHSAAGDGQPQAQVQVDGQRRLLGAGGRGNGNGRGGGNGDAGNDVMAELSVEGVEEEEEVVGKRNKVYFRSMSEQ